jgi:prevent-host-death family protein
VARTTTIAEVKAHFADWVRAAEAGASVVITRHGKPVVALVRASELEQLERLRAAGPETGLASLAGGWEGSEELADLIARTQRTPPREISGLD